MQVPGNRQPTRILMTTDTVGGVWSYTVELCRALIPFNIRFFLVTMGAAMHSSQKEEIAALENVQVFETEFKLEWMESPWQDIERSGRWLLELEEELLPDLVHLNCFSYGSLPWRSPVIVAAHSDVWSWWFAVNKQQPPVSWNEYYDSVRAGLHQADFVVAPSQSVMQNLREHYDVSVPGKVIYNARSSGEFYAAEKQPMVLSMGRIWDEAKNIRLLAEAAAAIRYPISIAGQSSFGSNNVPVFSHNITLTGKLPANEIARQLSRAAVYVLPAKYEPFGLSVLEAGMSGCALVLGDIDSLREIWQDAALFVDTDDSAAMAKTVNELMTSDKLRMHYADRAMQQSKKYSVQLMTESYLSLYRELLRRQPVYQYQLR